MLYILLAEEDRTQYEGCPERLPWDVNRLSIDEAIEVQERSGITPSQWREALRDPSAVVWKLAVWMCLNRAGLQIGYADVRFNWTALEVDNDQVDAEGKESSSTPPPPSGSESTG